MSAPAFPEPRFIRSEADVRSLPDGTYWCLPAGQEHWRAMDLFESFWWFKIADPGEIHANRMVGGWAIGPLPQFPIPERFPTPTVTP